MNRLTCILFFIGFSATAQCQSLTRICSYNVLDFPNSQGSERLGYFATILDSIMPQILVCQEITSEQGAEQFLQDVLGTQNWARADFITQGYSDAMLFYRSDLFALQDIYTVETELRNFEIYEMLYLEGASRPHLFIADTHLKASQGSENEQRRLSEVLDFINFLIETSFADSNIILCGDLNFYTSAEPGYQALLEDSTLLDPIDSPGNWHNNSQFAGIHTQSSRTTSFGGGASGGMDDRFDFILTAPELLDGSQWDYQAGSYTAFGNDGEHFNQSINESPNYAVSQEVADALYEASDHIPVFLDLEYIAESSIQPATTASKSKYQIISLYPNPLNSHTTILVNLPQASDLQIGIFNLRGARTDFSINGNYAPGLHRFLFDTSDLASGIYIIRVLVPGKLDEERKLAIVQ